MRFLVSLLCVLTTACASNTYKPEPKHPTPEQIDALLRMPVPRKKDYKPEPDVFRVEVYPQVILGGQSVWLKCFIPRHYGAGHMRLMLEGVYSKEAPIDKIETRVLVERIPCNGEDGWIASCSIVTDKGEERVEKTLMVSGCAAN